MDRFTKYALIAMILIVAVMTVSGYIGYKVGGNAATDDKVNAAASDSSTTVYYNPFTIEHWGVTGEYLGFCAAGCAGGFIVGYIFPSVMSNSAISRRKN
jgi:hypothetical protein